jgi:hypothetical protein
MSPVEIMCVILFWSIGNKHLAFSYTIGLKSNSKNKDVLGRQFFAKENVIRFMSEQCNNFIVNQHGEIIENEKSSDIQKIESTLNYKEEFTDTKITSENIQALLENQYAKTNDPEKKVLLLMKIAEFVGAKKTTEDTANLPVIYLPSRCKDCTILKNNAAQKL